MKVRVITSVNKKYNKYIHCFFLPVAHRSSNTWNGKDGGGDTHKLGGIKWIFLPAVTTGFASWESNQKLLNHTTTLTSSNCF